ncbi:MAG: SprT-like domain-containing protein [Flavobacteriaceae bacterium]
MTFFSFLPLSAIEKVAHLLARYPIEVRVVKKRKTKHGDFRQLPTGAVQITLNAQPNPYRFLITFLHELAHHIAFQEHGFRIRPHGQEWKQTFRSISIPFLLETIFPQPLLAAFAQHLKNPKASSDTDEKLGRALKGFDPVTDKKTIFELPLGAQFSLDNGRVFQKGEQRRKRFECVEIRTQRIYLFQPNAEVNRMEKL